MADDIHERLDKARSYARDNVERARDNMKQGWERANEQARTAREKAGEKFAASRERADRALTEKTRVVSDHPLAAVAAAAVVGAVAAYLLPKSARGVRSLGSKAAALAIAAQQEARRVARTGIDEASQAARSSIDATRDMASDLGEQVHSHLNADTLREQAEQVRERTAGALSKARSRFRRK